MRNFNYKTLLLFSFTFLFQLKVYADAPFAIPTFHSIGVYWTPSGGNANTAVLLEYRITGTNTWHNGLSMIYNPVLESGISEYTGIRTDKADYRGSLVNLMPNTSYDIRLTLEGTSNTTSLTISTWAETVPIGTTLTVGDLTTEYVVTTSGTANAYLLIDGTGSTIDVNNLFDQCIRLYNVDYVIIRGFTLKGGAKHGILFDEACSHIIIEDCDISGWGEINATGFGNDYQGGIHAGYIEVAQTVIQRNKIHHPRSNSNSWAELNIHGNFHPEGPQGITFYANDEGNNVIRYNEIWGDATHYFNDGMGGKENYSWDGFPGPDSDIYGNYVANCWDDGIEAEGSGANVRVWNNYIEEIFLPMGNANVSIGPLCMWNNVSARCYSPPGSEYGQFAAFIKMGYAEDVDGMTGHMYIFNNTILQPNGEGAGGLGSSLDTDVEIFQCITRNNILHVRNGNPNSVSTRPGNTGDFDYDLCSSAYPAGHENNGISGTPIYESGAPSFDFATKTGNFKLSSASPGYDQGLIIPNFTNFYNGNAPDMGAHEHGTADMIYGVNASFLPPAPLAVEYLDAFSAKIFGDKVLLSWATTTEKNADYFIIERTVDTEKWVNIGKLSTKNNTNVNTFYDTIDPNPLEGTSYYRLKQVDIDGSFSYSNIESVYFEKMDFSFYPNPSQGQLALVLSKPMDVEITVSTIVGAQVFQKMKKGSIIPLNLSHLSNGVYLIAVQTGQHIISKKVLIQH